MRVFKYLYVLVFDTRINALTFFRSTVENENVQKIVLDNDCRQKSLSLQKESNCL